MSSSDKSSRGVQTGLLVFGVPFIVAISTLAFLPQLPAEVGAYRNIISAVAALGALGVLLTFLLAWFADRRTVHRLDETIDALRGDLKLKNQELDSASEQHELELEMKQQELDQQLELLTQKAKIRDLENELKIRELKLELLEARRGVPDATTSESVRGLVIENTELTAHDTESA